MTVYSNTRLVAVLNIVGLGYFGENRIKIDYLINIYSKINIILNKYYKIGLW